jgi:hypothetical protein
LIDEATKIGPGEWMVDVRIQHPFAGLNYYTGFDVRGIIMFDAGFTFPGSGLSIPDGSATGGGLLLNPDGFTTLFNSTQYPPGSAPWPAFEYQKGKYSIGSAPSATLNPFKCYATTTPRRVFTSTLAETRSYHILFNTTKPIHCGYAIDASWAIPLKNPPKVPDDFPIEANMPEAYLVDFTVKSNSLWSDPSGGGGGDIRFSLKVYDHHDAHLVAQGGDVKEIRWEIPGMTGWDALTPTEWIDGVDASGAYVEYSFIEAPVPDMPGSHKVLFGIVDKETGIQDLPETAYLLSEIQVHSGQTCWMPGELVADNANESYQSHLGNSHAAFVDSTNAFHLFYLDDNYEIHHLVRYAPSTVSDDIVLPGEKGYNVNAVPADDGGIHMLYADDPYSEGGNIVYRYIDSVGEMGPPVFLSAQSRPLQFLTTLCTAPDGTILALWMDSSNQPGRKLCGSWFDGSSWSGEMILWNCDLPDGWVSPAMVADSSSVFHICYADGSDLDLYYMRFDHGSTSPPELVVWGPGRAGTPVMSIDPDNFIYTTFVDTTVGWEQGFLTIRSPLSGTWSEPVNLIGHNYSCKRFENQILPDGRMTIVWTDVKQSARSLYTKVFNPFLSESEIQELPDDEVDAPFIEQKNQSRMVADPNGTLRLAWSDSRSGHWQIYYSECTP